jgi:two-component system, NtrC family, nitrogen regulation response regulator NtrX
VKPILYIGCPQPERAAAEKTLATAGLSIVWVDSGSQALNELQRAEMPVLIDLSRGAAALQLARDLRAQRPGVLLFAVVDDKRPDLTAEAVLTGVADVFARPPAARRVVNALEREKSYESRQPPRTLEIGDALYAHSPSMREVLALIAHAAGLKAGVTIRGEEGAGRQVVARAIHAAQRESAAFVSVDCAAHEPDEFDTVLFGHATRPRHGESVSGPVRLSRSSRLHEALGGTLYLQNLADAPTRVQSRLARLLRDGEATHAESGATLRFDVRMMAGVDASVDAAAQDGRIRADLFKRLSAIKIEMPPLRSRREDIPALANYFLREICGSRRLPPKALSRPALTLIAALPWHGNAIELHAMLESIVAGLSGGKGIGLEDVLAHVRLDGGAAVSPDGGTLRQARARFESDYIARVLAQHHGRISDAARALGIRRTNLYRKMRLLQVKVDKHRR